MFEVTLNKGGFSCLEIEIFFYNNMRSDLLRAVQFYFLVTKTNLAEKRIENDEK